jgi:hypothetical protein
LSSTELKINGGGADSDDDGEYEILWSPPETIHVPLLFTYIVLNFKIIDFFIQL